jgi:hypothetical protein
METYKIRFNLSVSQNLCYPDTLPQIDQVPRSANRTAMSRYLRRDQYMNPNVFRSTSNPVYHIDSDLLIPRYIATDGSRSLRYGDLTDSRDSVIEDLVSGPSYRSDRRHHHNDYSSSSRAVDSIIRKYAMPKYRNLNIRITCPERITMSASQTPPSIGQRAAL